MVITEESQDEDPADQDVVWFGALHDPPGNKASMTIFVH